MTGVRFIALSGQDHNLDTGRIGDELADEAEAFVGPVGGRRQPEIDQGDLRRSLDLAQQTLRLSARLRDVNGEVSAEDEIQCIGDERIVIDDQQFRLGLLCHPRALPRLACNTAIVPDRPPDRSFSYGDGLPDTGKKRLLQIERGAKSVTKVCGRAGKSQPAFVYYADPIAELFDVG